MCGFMPVLTYQNLMDILQDYSHPLSICLAVRVGSQVYGTAQSDSDTDFVVINSIPQKPDLLFGHNYNVTIWSEEKFAHSLQNHSIFAFEVLSTPSIHRLYDQGRYPSFTFNAQTLAQSAISKSQTDWNKGLKILEYEQQKAQKKLWHAMRILMFACQIKEKRLIYDFTVACDLFEEIITDPSSDPMYYKQWLTPMKDQLCAILLNR